MQPAGRDPRRGRRSAVRVKYSLMRPAYLVLIAVPLALLLLLPWAPVHAAAQARTEAELRALREKIGRISEQGSRDAPERDRLSGNLRAAELSVGTARGELDRANREYAERSARRG